MKKLKTNVIVRDINRKKNDSKLLLYLINHDVKQERRNRTACVVDHESTNTRNILKK